MQTQSQLIVVSILARVRTQYLQEEVQLNPQILTLSQADRIRQSRMETRSVVRRSGGHLTWLVRKIIRQSRRRIHSCKILTTMEFLRRNNKPTRSCPIRDAPCRTQRHLWEHEWHSRSKSSRTCSSRACQVVWHLVRMAGLRVDTRDILNRCWEQQTRRMWANLHQEKQA